jgi:hypothetical protein
MVGAWRVPDEWLVSGFADAIERVRASGLSGEEGFRAMFVVMAWAGALCDRFKDSGAQIPTLSGLWYMRNLTLHAGMEVVWAAVGFYGYGTLGSGSPASKTRKSPRLFPRREALRERKSQRDRGADEYETHVAMRPVIAVLEGALEEATAAATGAHTGAHGG